MFFASRLVSSCLGTLSDVIASECVCVCICFCVCRRLLACGFKCVSSVVSIIGRAYCVCIVTFKKEAFWMAEINSSFLNFVNFSHCLQSF